MQSPTASMKTCKIPLVYWCYRFQRETDANLFRPQWVRTKDVNPVIQKRNIPWEILCHKQQEKKAEHTLFIYIYIFFFRLRLRIFAWWSKYLHINQCLVSRGHFLRSGIPPVWMRHIVKQWHQKRRFSFTSSFKFCQAGCRASKVRYRLKKINAVLKSVQFPFQPKYFR